MKLHRRNSLRGSPASASVAAITATAVVALLSVIGGTAWAATGSDAGFSAEVQLQVDEWGYAGEFKSEAIHRCAADQVMVGVIAPQLENYEEYPWVQCAYPTVAGHDGINIVASGSRSQSDWLLPGNTEQGAKTLGHDCVDAPMTDAVHVQGGRYASAKFRCQALAAQAKQEHLVGVKEVKVVVDETWQSDELFPDDGRFEYSCPDGMSITGREDTWRQHSPNAWNRIDKVRFTCASWKVVAT